MENIRNDRGKASIDETPSSLNSPTIAMMLLEMNRTNVYTETDLEMKRKKLQVCKTFLPKTEKRRPFWTKNLISPAVITAFINFFGPNILMHPNKWKNRKCSGLLIACCTDSCCENVVCFY